ncbi:hypothetical protein [Promicromonospora aerolata]|uniref:SWIM-type domain-containing protein n=1 Tax=Promicromonospora aerolata TaxID=195749 RepID=A0ABW4V1I9_9MICO
MMATILGKIRKERGAAGQFAYHVTFQYGEDLPFPVCACQNGRCRHVMTFIGNEFSESVYATLPGNDKNGNPIQVRVVDPERFGPRLTPSWVRAYIAGLGEPVA